MCGDKIVFRCIIEPLVEQKGWGGCSCLFWLPVSNVTKIEKLYKEVITK